MRVTIRHLNAREAREKGIAAGFAYHIETGDTDGECFEGFGFPTYRATLKCLLRFASK